MNPLLGKPLLTPASTLAASAALLALAPLLGGSDVTVPNTFQAGTAARADEVNENFQALASAIKLARAGLREPQKPIGSYLFSGPTGVGKTTTLAKLAAHYLGNHSNSVAMITIDTYRIAAVRHLKVYGEIMHLPVEVVLSP